MNSSAGAAAPIFVHSLFRAGSTYMFQVFRRSPANYWCYQEPLHEAALLSRERPQDLLAHDGRAMRRLRHPALDRPYFQELHETYAAWRNQITKEILYDDSFGGAGRARRTAFFKVLIEAARSRCMIQECRTAHRIAEMRADLGGVHLYLWRNPWDQWWSYKVADYFDAVTQLQLNAAKPPPAIMRLRKAIGFEPFHHADVRVEFAHFMSRRLTPEASYLAFHVLWWLALAQAREASDALVNVDALSDSPEYRAQVLATLAEMGIEGLDFDDCRIPQAHFDGATQAFFATAEERAREILVGSGARPEVIEGVDELRERHAPRGGGSSLRAEVELAQLRELALRYEAEAAALGAELRAIHADASWRLTAPLRRVAALLRGKTPRADGAKHR